MQKLSKKVTVHAVQKILEDGNIYDTDKSVEIFSYCYSDKPGATKTYFLAQNGRVFSAEESVNIGYSSCDDGKCYNVDISYSNLKLEPENELNRIKLLKVKKYVHEPIKDAIQILRHELLTHGEIYEGFKLSLKSALEKYNCCGLPFEPEEEIAEKILDFMIGEEKEVECD